MIAIFKRELKSYFNGTVGCLFIAVLLAFTGVFVTNFNLIGGYAAFEYSLESTSIVFLLAVPILAMRSMNEDRRIRTDKLLYSLPIKLSGVILGKYLAMVAVLAVSTLILAFYPLILSAFGAVHFASAYASLLAFFLLGAALIAVCMFLSSLAESQIVAAIIGFAAVLILYMAKSLATMIPESAAVSLVCFLAIEALVGLASFFLTKNLPFSCGIGTGLGAATLLLFLLERSLFTGLFPKILSQLALFDRFNTFTYGLLSIPTLILYLSVCVFFVALTILGAEKKRWN